MENKKNSQSIFARKYLTLNWTQAVFRVTDTLSKRGRKIELTVVRTTSQIRNRKALKALLVLIVQLIFRSCSRAHNRYNSAGCISHLSLFEAPIYPSLSATDLEGGVHCKCHCVTMCEVNLAEVVL